MGVNASRGTSHSTTEQTGTSHSTSDGTSHGTSDTTSQQESHGTTDTRGTGRTQQVELCNKSVEELLERIENQLKRVKESEDYGCITVQRISFRLLNPQHFWRPTLTAH